VAVDDHQPPHEGQQKTGRKQQRCSFLPEAVKIESFDEAFSSYFNRAMYHVTTYIRALLMVRCQIIIF